jgi:RNA polymerase sigma-70 factor (ECF subfamily)
MACTSCSEHAPRDGAAQFGQALEGYRAALRSLALDRTGSMDAAEEIAQQAIAKAWEHRDSIRDRGALAGWLFRIAINCCLEWQRRQTSIPVSPTPGAEAGGSVWEEVVRRETIREARRALSGIPLKNRVALLTRLAGHTYREISEFLEVPASTVRGRLARARSQLRPDLARRLGISPQAKETDSDECL